MSFDLELTSFPMPRRPKGSSYWRLARRDNKRCEFPTNQRLHRLFKGQCKGLTMKIDSRGDNFVLFLVTLGIMPSERNAFLRAIQEFMEST